MDGSVLVALVGLLVLGVLGVIALAKGGRINLESHAGDKLNKVKLEGGAKHKS